MVKGLNEFLKLYYVTNQELNTDDWLLSTIEQALQGGVNIVQLREKKKPKNQIVKLAQKVKALLKSYNVPLMINDDIEVCLEVGASGVHLGQNDIHPNEARKLLGNKAIIGWSLENIAQAHLANELSSIDYVAASPVFKSSTKTDCNEAWGLGGLSRLTQMSRYPVVGIGGINLQNSAQVIKAGAKGVAVVSAIQQADDKKMAANELLKKINSNL